MHFELKYVFPHIHRRNFLKYLYIPQKFWLVYVKIHYFKTAPHLPANKFFMDFGAVSRSKVQLYKDLCDERR